VRPTQGDNYAKQVEKDYPIRDRIQLNGPQLRIVQIICLLLAVSACWLAAHTGDARRSPEFGPLQWAIVLAATYGAVSGFTFQRFLNKNRPRSRLGGAGSTPYRRWSVGHLMRLATACSVALWGAVTPILKGPLWMAYAFCGVGILLLLVWTPGTPPPDTSDTLT
jgi:hypothetical protein